MQGGSTPVQQQPAAKVKREGWTKTKVGLVVIAAAAVAVAIGAVVAFFALSPSGSGNTNAVANSSAGATSVNADARGGANANAGTAAAASNVAPAAENRPANVSTNVNSNYANNAAVADDPVLGAALPALNGGTFRLADYAGKVVVLNLWATWCGPCRSETPSLVRMSRDYRKRGVEVIGLSTEDAASSREKVRAFAQEFGIDYRLGFAPRDFALRLMNGDARIPQTFVMRDGRELNRFIGYNEQRPQQLRAAVEQALTAR
jgi:thiol-disulfide isomerase/thioredoxin